MLVQICGSRMIVMKSTQNWSCYDLARYWWDFLFPIHTWDTLLDTLVRSGIIVITHIVLQYSLQLSLVQQQHMVQALSFQTAHESFTNRIRLRSLKWCFQLFDA